MSPQALHTATSNRAPHSITNILLFPPPAALTHVASLRDPGGQEVFGAKAHERTLPHMTNVLDSHDTDESMSI